MSRLLAGLALLCLLVSPIYAKGTNGDKPKEPKPPEVRVDPRLPEIGVAWWATDGRTRSGPYYSLYECQRAILRTRLRCELVRD